LKKSFNKMLNKKRFKENKNKGKNNKKGGDGYERINFLHQVY